ncbi:unnamed protein product [Zymoseptoria tritici ST99CH_3D7]|uniref:Uncharacterized protein n=1 Tax=Zymoseptoria tritici (strain ST99CH_3D7) TaxID=1276538 RepID=A0A1X7RWY5_ZYMT9|nr:unnamed protein product [Zymoseptoria tritici ST99CH_3D7]
MLETGLATLWPQFSPRDEGNLEWAEKVRRIRKELSNSENSPYDIDRSDAEQADTALRIAALFGPDWRLPMTIHFLALLKGALHATNIKAILTRNGFQDEDLIERLQMNVIPYNGMPELRRLETIVRFIHAHEQDEWSV